jgi:hypothetical protein
LKNAKKTLGYFASAVILVSDFLYLFLLFKNKIFEQINNLNSDIIQIKLFDFITLIPLNLGIPGGITYKFFIAACILLFLLIFLINKKSLIILLFSVFCMEFILIYAFFAGVFAQKAFLAVLFLIFSCWILEKKNKILWITKDITLIIILALIFLNPPFYKMIDNEIHNYFSNQNEISRYLIPNLNKNEKVLLVNNYYNNSEYFYAPYLTDIPNQNIEILYDSTEIVDNKFLDEYIDKNKTNIKYILIDDNTKQDIQYPYVEVFQSPQNSVLNETMEQTPCNYYHIYMKIENN